MMQIRKYIPGVCWDGRDTLPTYIEFNNVKELMGIDFVKRWSLNPLFHQYSISDDPDDVSLMAELNGGKEWWVIGSLQGDNIKNMHLPKWSPVR